MHTTALIDSLPRELAFSHSLSLGSSRLASVIGESRTKCRCLTTIHPTTAFRSGSEISGTLACTKSQEIRNSCVFIALGYLTDQCIGVRCAVSSRYAGKSQEGAALQFRFTKIWKALPISICRGTTKLFCGGPWLSAPNLAGPCRRNEAGCR
jgi:hypothetical protein